MFSLDYMNSILSPCFKYTKALRPPPLDPARPRSMTCFLGTASTFTFTGCTLYKANTAFLISGLVADLVISKVYTFCSMAELPFSVTLGFLMICVFIILYQPHVRHVNLTPAF